MAANLIIIICFLLLIFFLCIELNTARKWRRLVKYPQKYGFTNEEFYGLMKRDRDIAKKNKIFEWTWLNPTSDIKKVRKAGFIRVPIHIHIGFVDELPCHTSPYYRGKILSVEGFDVGWKDKYDTPRFETNPHVYITLFNLIGINIIWGFKYDYNLPEKERYDVDRYWEQALWCVYYCGGDLDNARRTWPWRNMEDESTWDEKYIRKSKRI